MLAAVVRGGLRWLHFDGALLFLVAGTIFATACGSGSVLEVLRVGLVLRWVFLALLGAVAVAAVVAARPHRLPPATYALAVVLLALVAVSATWSVDPWLTVQKGASL